MKKKKLLAFSALLTLDEKRKRKRRREKEPQYMDLPQEGASPVTPVPSSGSLFPGMPWMPY